MRTRPALSFDTSSAPAAPPAGVLSELSAPLSFHPVYKDYLWGGGRIPARFRRAGAPAPCAESWEISGHPDGMGVVADGPLAGTTLQELCLRYGADLLGTRAPRPDRFPLLVKLIDARDRLSVQVHPSAADLSADPLEIKNECWHVLDCDSGARIYAGFRPGVSKADLRDALAGRGAASLLNELFPEPDETLFIPAGLVHAIGAGCLVYEVQQASNTTYRLYDWDRVGPDGMPRALHVSEALRSIDGSLPPPALVPPSPIPGTPFRLCVSTPFFQLLQLEVTAPMPLRTDGESFHILFAKTGSFTVVTPGGEAPLPHGASLLVPAAAGAYTLVPSAPAPAGVRGQAPDPLAPTALLTHL